MTETTPQADTGLANAFAQAEQPAPLPKFDTVNVPISELAQRAAQVATSAGAAPEQPAASPSPPIQFAEPVAPVVKTVEQVLLERGLHPSQQIQQPAFVAPPPERTIVVGDMQLVDRGSEIVLERLPPAPAPVHQPAARSERAMTRLELELAAGQRRVAQHRESQGRRAELRAKPSAAELAAQGHNTPVFRPGDVIESGRLNGGTVFPQSHVFAGKPPQG